MMDRIGGWIGGRDGGNRLGYSSRSLGHARG
jgi:hypothetical protein